MVRRWKGYRARPGAVAVLLSLIARLAWRRIKGWLLGVRWIYFWRFGRWIPRDALERHAYVVGGTGSGKSELLKVIAFHLLRRPDHAVVFIDPHGDAASQLARFREFRRGDRLLYIDPYRADVAGRYPCFNTFALPSRTPRAVTAATQQHIDVFREILSDVFTVAMEGALVPCLYTLLEAGGMALDDLYYFMNDDLNGRYVKLGKQSRDETVRHFFRHEFPRVGRQTRDAIARRLQVLLNHRFFRHFLVGTGARRGRSSFDLKSAIEARKAIVFRLNGDELGPDVAHAIGRFVVARLNMIALGRSRSPRALRTPTFVIIDECHHFITRSVAHLLTGARKYGMHLVLAQQQYGQGMPPAFVDAVSNNTAVKFCGRASTRTRKTFAEETDADPAVLGRLTAGRFMLHVQRQDRTREPFCVRGFGGFLGHRNAMPRAAWKSVQERQFNAYYHPLPDAADTAPPPPDVKKTASPLPYPLD